MIFRLFTLLGLVAVLGGLYLILPQGVGPIAFQTGPANSAIPGYIEEGLFPEPASLVENEDIGHDVFEQPAEDEVRIAEAVARMAETMPAMDMTENADMNNGGADMNMGAGGEMPADMDNGEADMNMGAGGEMPADMDNGEADMNMSGTDGDAADTMNTAAAEGTEMVMDDATDTMNTAEVESTEMPAGMDTEMPDEMEMGSGGLLILADGAEVDREIEIDMREWGYSLGDLEVNPGDRIRLTIRNAGQIPHEFMFMPMANMQAIGYRLERADWNLLEHEAPFERSVLLPGETFQVSLQIQTTGAWMFMCMFPYHMQLGMMGQMATPGMAMQM